MDFQSVYPVPVFDSLPGGDSTYDDDFLSTFLVETSTYEYNDFIPPEDQSMSGVGQPGSSSPGPAAGAAARPIPSVIAPVIAESSAPNTTSSITHAHDSYTSELPKPGVKRVADTPLQAEVPPAHLQPEIAAAPAAATTSSTSLRQTPVASAAPAAPPPADESLDGEEDKLAKARERNRIHAKKSRLRKKFFVDSLKRNVDRLEAENRQLRQFIAQQISTGSTTTAPNEPTGTCSMPSHTTPALSASDIMAGEGRQANRTLGHADFALMKALSSAQQNFVLTDPNLPDNPIVFASPGFFSLTGYSSKDVIGRNCRLLQGPGTEPDTVKKLREGILGARDTTACLINYRKDGTPFWNNVFVAPLCGVDGSVVNFVGVQCPVSDEMARQLLAEQAAAEAHGDGAARAAASAIQKAAAEANDAVDAAMK